MFYFNNTIPIHDNILHIDFNSNFKYFLQNINKPILFYSTAVLFFTLYFFYLVRYITNHKKLLKNYDICLNDKINNIEFILNNYKNTIYLKKYQYSINEF